MLFLGIGLNTACSIFTSNISAQMAAFKPMTAPPNEKKKELIADYKQLLASDDIQSNEFIKASNIIAASFYVDHGVIVDVMGEDGNRVKFSPSNEQKKLRKDMLQADALIRYSAHNTKLASKISFYIILCSIILGALSLKIEAFYFRFFAKKYTNQ